MYICDAVKRIQRSRSCNLSEATSVSKDLYVRCAAEIRTPLSIARMGVGAIQNTTLVLKDVFQVSEYSEMKQLFNESLEAMEIS